MNELTLPLLWEEAIAFCERERRINHPELIGITDGKAVGTYVEHKFQQYLSSRYDLLIGSSAKGIDLPSEHINTDIKVTSYRLPQSSCPFKNARQKIYGLGYHLLIFVYEKADSDDSCSLNFINCTFIEKQRTGDYTITARLREMLRDGANKEDIIGYLMDKNVPGDEIVYHNLAEEILMEMPKQGVLTISNALQWRLQYTRAIGLDNKMSGVSNYGWD